MRNEEGNNYITDYSYDKNGNQLTKVKSESWPSTTKKQRLGIKTASELSGSQSSEYFTYNVFNQLKSYRNTEGKTASYEYLPNNYRYSKTVGSTTTRFLWDGDYVIGELDSIGNISKKYFYGKDMISDNSGNYDRAEEIYYNVKDRVGDNDYICADFRKENHYSEDGANNPTIKVFDSYRADASTMENISHKLIIYDTENPSNWNRSYVSILREWKAHNAMYNLGVARNRTKDVDLDSKAENTIIFYNYQYN